MNVAIFLKEEQSDISVVDDSGSLLHLLGHASATIRTSTPRLLLLLIRNCNRVS